MPRHDDNNEPQRRRQQDGENRPQRPTQDRTQPPRFDIPQQGPEHLPAGPNDQPPQRGREQEPNRAPNLDRATGDETRRATGNASIPGDMRDMLNRLNRIDRPGDMSDEEARRLAGLDSEGEEPRPVEPNLLPAVTRHEVARISQEIQAAGQVYPKWHGIKNLPGFQNRQIRGMGQDLFSMFTTTHHHDILTISTMANSEREVKAVLAWLQQNAEALPEVNIDYSGYGMGGYQPKVREFKTDNTRFHVVQDPAGWYIYAYPEGTAVEHSGKDELEYDGGDDEDNDRDEYGAKIPKRLRENNNMKQFSTISEQIRYLTNKLDFLQESSLIDELTEEAMEEVMIDEASSLLNTIGREQPGIKALMKALHSRHGLAAGSRGARSMRPGWDLDPNYELVPAAQKNIARAIKASKDNFCIIAGSEGIAAIKPQPEDWDRSERPTHNNNLRWVVVYARGDEPAEVEIAKFRIGRTDATGGTSGHEGGAPNTVNYLQDKVGNIQNIYLTQDAVERFKGEFRTQAKKPAQPTTGGKLDMPSQDPEGNWSMQGQQPTPAPDVRSLAVIKIRPLASKMFHQVLGQLGPRIQRLSAGGNYDAVEKLTKVGKRIQAMSTALDAANPDFSSRYGGLGGFVGAVHDAVGQLQQGMDEQQRLDFAHKVAASNPSVLGPMLDIIRTKLFALSE